jgi:hypothetical protein
VSLARRPSMGSAQEDLCSAFLPNGSALDRRLPQVLEAQQHGEHPFELAVEMDLIANRSGLSASSASASSPIRGRFVSSILRVSNHGSTSPSRKHWGLVQRVLSV